MKDMIIYEDAYIVCVNKPASIPSQPDKTKDRSILEMAEEYLGYRLYPVNRIDRPASGIVLFAKSSRAAGKLSQILNTEDVEKTYLAIVENKPKVLEDILSEYLTKKNNKAYITDKSRGKKAVLDYRYIGSSERYHFLSVGIKTGRFHQIRCQLANINCIIKGDVKYGARRKNKDRSIGLHAFKLSITHPYTKEKITFRAEPPDTTLWKEVVKFI